MKKLALMMIACCFSTLAAAKDAAFEHDLTAARIVEKNIAARGGLDAWRKIETMVWVGHLESAGTPAAGLPFALEMKRPNKTRFEIKSQNQVSVRMFDGKHGWKIHPANRGEPAVQPYTPDELSFARDAQGIDGALLDYQAKGVEVAFDGIEEVEGNKAYRLNVKLPSGASHHVWIDAKTFLDVKYDRMSRGPSGQSALVSVFSRNYKTIEGLQIPLLIESQSDNSKATDKMVIDKVLLNPPLDDRAFAKPGMAGWTPVAHAGLDPARQVRSVGLLQPRSVQHTGGPQ